MLENSRVDLLISVLFISDLIPIHWLILAHRQMHQGKLSVVSQLTHLPLQVVLVVAQEDLLGHHVAVRQLKDLRVKILLLLWD